MLVVEKSSNVLPLSLYIHLPWCIKKCPYCDFNSYQLKNNLPEAEYITALVADLRADLNFIESREIATIFFGGGTPSLFSAVAIAKLLEELQKFLKFANNIEITLEANPSTVEQKYLPGYKAAGVNRISLGAQSFQADKLQILERVHTSKEIFLAVENVLRAGFQNYNLDLMYGLPTQTLQDAIFDLQTAIACQPQHISWYELTKEPGTPFYQQDIVVPPEELRINMFTEGVQLLQAAGFARYEISAYAKNGYQCRHNLNYWQFGDYLGIGAGAHSKLTSFNHKILRRYKYNTPSAYMAATQNFCAEEKIIAAEALPAEFMLNALRLIDGFDIALFNQRTKLPIEKIMPILKKASTLGMLDLQANKIKPTAFGTLFLNDLIQLFM